VPISFYVKSDDEYLNVTLWLPEVSRGEGLVFCHGWGGGSQYDDLLQALADHGYLALRFHQRGYGNSTGKSDLSLWVSDMAKCASVLDSVTHKIWAAGQSTGGTMSLIAAATQECFAGAVALAPFCSLQQILLDNTKAKPILESRFGPLQDKDFRAADATVITRGMTKPVLLIHGTKDETVPIAHGQRLVQSAREATRFVPIESGNHHLRNGRSASAQQRNHQLVDSPLTGLRG
jgi:pimeloyl-ACP methyl ester carboxylesterase